MLSHLPRQLFRFNEEKQKPIFPKKLSRSRPKSIGAKPGMIRLFANYTITPEGQKIIEGKTKLVETQNFASLLFIRFNHVKSKLFLKVLFYQGH